VLNERERRIFETRRLADEPVTLAELAEEFGVTRERVRQIEVRAFEKVRNNVKHHIVMETPALQPAGSNPAPVVESLTSPRGPLTQPK
ncbi:MAG: sigma factor-like helix-turn-helix DNA-binding protein, partial [Rhodoplanes sp.]